MVQYRREYKQQSTVFLTFTLKNRQSDWLVRYIDEIKQAIRYAKNQQPFDIIALCILPEHIHLIMALPPNESNFSHRVRLIKSAFCQQLATKLPLAKNARGEYNVWQRRFWEHTIRDEANLQRCVDYVHFNPVKHGLVTQVKDWPYSSFHRAVHDGHINANWGGEYVAAEGNWGE